MVTKRAEFFIVPQLSSVLAKIHMVTKLTCSNMEAQKSSVLAKIHMVTKQPVQPVVR